jgi:hypothetical protein
MALHETNTTYSTPEVVRETPFSRLSGAVDRLHKVASQMSNAADALCGEQVTGEGLRKAKAPVGGGFFGGIEELADQIDDMAADIGKYASRIQSRI